jgi:hypothetical protein
MKKRWSGIIVGLVFIIALSACTASISEDSGGELDHSGGLPPVAAVKARELLSAKLGTSIESITIDSQVQRIWSDTCLGLGGIAESCLRTEVRGWLVKLSANGEMFNARTDELGEQVRFES